MKPTKGSIFAASDLLSCLESRGYLLGKQLNAVLDIPLRTYLKQLIPTQPAKYNRHMSYCLRALEHWLIAQSYEGVDDICDHLLKVPIIQQADHSNLLLNEETFMNNLLFSLACREAGVNTMITLQCSTVCCLSKREPVTGPNFLRTRGRLYTVFPSSKRLMKNSNFCVLPEPVQTGFHLIDEKGECNDSFIEALRGRKFENASRAYSQINQELWEGFDNRVTVPAIFSDDGFTSELIALHLGDKESPIYRMIFDPEVRYSVLTEKRKFVNSDENIVINRSLPDFFWFKRKNKLVSLILVTKWGDTYFVAEVDNRPVDISFDPISIAQLLRSGKLFPDQFISYFARCLLSGITALGGTSQQDYIAHYQTIIINANKTIPFLDATEQRLVARIDAGGLGGSPLVELSIDQKEFVSHVDYRTDLTSFVGSFLDRPVGETIGTFSCARYLIT